MTGGGSPSELHEIPSRGERQESLLPGLQDPPAALACAERGLSDGSEAACSGHRCPALKAALLPLRPSPAHSASLSCLRNRTAGWEVRWYLEVPGWLRGLLAESLRAGPCGRTGRAVLPEGEPAAASFQKTSAGRFPCRRVADFTSLSADRTAGCLFRTVACVEAVPGPAAVVPPPVPLRRRILRSRRWQSLDRNAASLAGALCGLQSSDVPRHPGSGADQAASLGGDHPVRNGTILVPAHSIPGRGPC